MTPTPPSKAAGIALAIIERLRRIQRCNGFHTDAGLTVYYGKGNINSEKLPAITLHEDEDRVDRERAQAHAARDSVDSPVDYNLVLPFIIEATAEAADVENPSLTGHALIADIKRAIFATDLTFGGLATGTIYTGRRISPRPEGQEFVAAMVMMNVHYVEYLNEP